jgi:hypothetical protein
MYLFRPTTADEGIGFVILHGLFGDPLSMRLLAKHLGDHGATVVIPRLPYAAPAATAVAGGWVEAAEEAVEAARASAQHIFIIGFYTGALLALSVAPAADVAGVVLAFPPRIAEDPRSYLLMRNRVFQFLRRKRLVSAIPVPFRLGTGGDQGGVLPPGFAEPLFALEQVASDNLSLQTPVLVCGSVDDEEQGTQTVARTYARLPGPLKLLEWVSVPSAFLGQDSDFARSLRRFTSLALGRPAMGSDRTPQALHRFVQQRFPEVLPYLLDFMKNESRGACALATHRLSRELQALAYPARACSGPQGGHDAGHYWTEVHFPAGSFVIDWTNGLPGQPPVIPQGDPRTASFLATKHYDLNVPELELEYLKDVADWCRIPELSWPFLDIARFDC